MATENRTQSESQIRSSEHVSPLACPFCGVKAKEHDGDYVLDHTSECFLAKHYAQEMWLVGKRKVQIWNKRANIYVTGGIAGILTFISATIISLFFRGKNDLAPIQKGY